MRNFEDTPTTQTCNSLLTLLSNYADGVKISFGQENVHKIEEEAWSNKIWFWENANEFINLTVDYQLQPM